MVPVQWTPAALADLAALWTDADSEARRRITLAVDEVDRQLVIDPLSAGESRAAGVRLVIAAPLGVQFRVVGRRRLVQVFHVWRFATP